MTKKAKSTKIVKPLTKKEIQAEVRKITSYDEHPDTIYEKVGMYVANSRSGLNNEEGLKYMTEHLLKVYDYQVNHINLKSTVSGNLGTALVEITNNLIEEYNCNTTLEKTLCEIIANSYGKIMSISKQLNNSLSFEYFGNERNGFISIMSKELDRANKNYLNALNNLIELKRPNMNIKVNTNNLYMGQNQQFNTNHLENENIKD